jgi:uncharacterized cupin superfamily protein
VSEAKLERNVPGRPNGMYYAETGRQEAILVLASECTLLIEEDERTLRAWDFVHLPAGRTTSRSALATARAC